MSEPLKRLVIQTLDLQEQGERKYLIFPPAELADRGVGVVGVDEIEAHGQMIAGYVDGKPVVTLPIRSGWACYATSLIRCLSREEALREVAAEAKATSELTKQLYPGHGDEVDKLLDALKEPPDSHPGQYV